jgi:seryl-tRNA synthetase
MLDINLFRVEKGGNPEIIKESQRRRFASVELIDNVIELDKVWIQHRFNVDQFNKEINSLQLEIADLKKIQKTDKSADISAIEMNIQAFLVKKNSLEHSREQEQAKMDSIWQELKLKLISIGNLVHETVYVSDNEDNNDLIRNWQPEAYPHKVGEACKSAPLIHHELLAKINGYDSERGAHVMGHRGYFLKNYGVLLNQALINYGLNFLWKKGFTLMQTPFMMKKEVMAETCQLSQFDEELYKVTGDGVDKYLIATSEQPIAAFHRQEWLDPKTLPLRYAGVSTCFRKEAGAHGKDAWGIFRTHQFEKVEQFIYTEPEKSWEMFEEMIRTSEEFYQSLDIPYRIVGIVSGALNNAAAKKYDLEAWFPGSSTFLDDIIM